MKKRQAQLLVVVILVLPILILYLYKHYTLPQTAFPLQTSTIEQVMKTQNLPWTVEEYTSFADGQSVYMLHNENGKATSTLSSTNVDNKRAMDLFFIINYPNPAQTNLSQEITEDDWFSMFELTSRLYGGKNNSKKVFNQVNNFLKNEEYEPKDRLITWHKQMNNIHYVVLFRPSYRYYNRFDLISIKMFNEAGYKKSYPNS